MFLFSYKESRLVLRCAKKVLAGRFLKCTSFALDSEPNNTIKSIQVIVFMIEHKKGEHKAPLNLIDANYFASSVSFFPFTISMSSPD